MTLTVNAELDIAGVEETITITGESPVVDVKSTTTGTNFSEELLEDIPNARDIWASMAQAPGFQMTGYDVGGSHTGTQTGFQTYGFNDQNRTLLEGINVTEGTNANAGLLRLRELRGVRVRRLRQHGRDPRHREPFSTSR